MAISLGDIKKKKITVSPLKNTNTNNTTYNVAPPVNNQREKQTYNLGEIKNNNITVTPLSERPKSKILAPSPQETMTINSINNKINENISKQIVSGGIQNDIHNMNMIQAGKSSLDKKIDLSGKDKLGKTTPVDTSNFIYNDTGKKYGDYYYDNYELYKDMPIYEQQGKYYLKTNNGYEELGRLDKNGNVAQYVMTTKEADKEELEKAKKLGYKDNLTKITTQEYDNAQETFKKFQKEYKLSDKELNNWIRTGDLPIHVSIQTNSMTNLKQKANDYRAKMSMGAIQQYDQQGFDINKQIYMDTHNMNDEQKQQYISYITGKKDPTKKNESTFFKGSSLFDDGYQFGDVTGATLGSIGNAGYSLLKGTGKFIEGTSDFAENAIGSGLELTASDKDKKDVTTFHNNTMYTGYKYGNQNYWYDEKSKTMYDENWKRVDSFNLDRFQKRYTYSNGVAEFGRQMKEQTIPDETSQVFDEILYGNELRKASVLGNKSEAMLESLGQALPMMGAGGSVEGLYGAKAAVATTSGLTFSSTYGNAKTEAIRNGATEKEAMETAFVQATSETISEQFFDSVPWARSAGWGDKLVGKVGNSVEKYLGSKTAKIVTKTLDISGEGFEEIISNMLTAGGNDIVHYIDSDYSYGMENQTGNILEDMKNAMTSQDSMDSFISAIITSAILNGGSAKVNSVKINKIVKTYAQEYNMSIEEAKARLKISDDNIEFDTSNINQKQNTPNLPNNPAVQQRNTNNNINNQVGENIQNNMPTIENNTQEKYSNVKPPMVIKYQATDNEKINSFRQSAVKEGMIDSQKTTNAMNVIEKVISDKDYNVKFDRTITNLDGKSVDGKININKNGEVEIALNPNSDRAVEFLLTHEITHAIETNELRGIILDYANKNSEFKSALQDLQKTYGTTNVSDEVIADISGQILGNQEFINSLSMQNTEQSRGIIKNIYHSIQRLLNKLTTKGRYRNFVEDLKTKWREAYRLATNETAVNNLKNDSKYSFISEKGLDKAIKVDNSNYQVKQKLDLAKKLEKSKKSDGTKYTNEEIRQATMWFKDPNGKWILELSDKNANFYNINKIELKKKYKIKDIFRHPALFEAYDELANTNIEFKHIKEDKNGTKIGAYYDPFFKKIVMNDFLLEPKYQKYAKKLLLHEMQHKIQQIEGLEKGDKGKNYIRYYTSLGEIQSSDVEQRSDYDYKDIMKIMPKSAQENPIHPYIERLHNNFNTKSSQEDLKNPQLAKLYNKIYNEGEVGKYDRKEINKKGDTNPNSKTGIFNHKRGWNNRGYFQEELDNSSFSLKEKQLEIIKKNNPMTDDYHVGIRTVEDIKTPEEAFKTQIDEDEDYIYPDFTKTDGENALKTGKITVYSSYEIKQGSFVSPSKLMAQDYSGNGKVFEKTIDINDVAWIDSNEGQYAKVEQSNNSKVVDNKGRTLSKEQQEFFKDSKIRDENGNLLTMYHGTPNGNFTEFNPGSYFSSNENYANNYQDENASILKQNKGVSNKTTYQVYLNITNPFELNNSVARDIYINEFIKGGNSGYFDPYTSYNDYVQQFNNNDGFEWLEAEDLKEWILENHPEFDGLVVQEVPDNVDPDAVNLAYIPFNSNQIKNVDNLNPTENNDIRYSQKTSSWQEHLDKNYKPTGTRTYFDEITNKKIAPLNPNATTKQNKIKPPIAKEYQKNTIAEKIEKSDNVIKVQAEEIANQLNSGKPLNTKERRWIETSTESEILKDKVFKEDLDVNKINYEIQSNKKSLREANEKLDLMGYDKSINYVKNLLDDGKIPTATDVALAQRTLQEAAKKGDTEVVQNLVMDVAILGTELGQATQALSIINKLTPEGQLKLYSKIVHRAKMMGDKSFQDVEITPEMVEMILNAYDKNGNYDQNDLNNRVEQFKQKVADQLKTSVEEKIDAWRYLSMLGNPKTHIRNIVSNVAMKCTIAYKNALARTIETFAPINTRTKTWKKSSQEVKQYAKETATEMKDVITGETKYGEQASIESKKRIFKFAPLENISNLNSNLLEAEDWLFSKSAFINTFQEYLTANGIKTMEDIKNNPEIVEKGKLYSVEQAEIATFRQYSKLASAINKIERNNKVAKYVIKATVPFKKTPINVAKAGVKYSPLGLIKNVTYDIYQVKKGNINASQFIDNLSQGLSGTTLTILGYALAKAGILTGANGDDKDDKYDSYLGKQGYSIKIGNKYYSLSWLSPTAMPMFVGANIHEQFEEQKGWDMNILSESLTKTLDPLNEMSFVSSLTDALNSYGSGNDKIKGMGESVAQSYIGQFFPTLFSQFANVGDDTKRSTKASSNSSYKFGEQTVRSIMYKIPGLRNKLEPSTDIWGNEIKQNENILMRALESFILPYSAKEYKNSSIDKEIKKVYNDVGNTDVIPGFPQSYVKYDKEQYRMSAKEYTKYKKTYGTSANTMLNMLMNTSNYKNSTGKRKTRMIKKVYDYSREISKEEFLSNRNIDYDKKDFKYNKNDYKKIVNYITSSTQYKDDD